MLSPKFKSSIAIIGLLYCSFILSSHYVLTKNISKFMDAPMIMAYRFLIAAIPLILYVCFKKKNPFRNIMPGIILGIFLWIIFTLITNGVRYTTVSNAGFISGAFIIFVPFILYFIFKIKPTFYNILALLVALLGLYILIGGLHKINLGDYLILTSSAFTAFHLSYVSKFVKSSRDVVVLCLQQFTVVSILSFMLAIIKGYCQFHIPQEQIYPLIFLGLLPTLSVFLIQVVALKQVTEITAALILSLQPLFATLFAIWLGGEKIHLNMIIGGFLIICANIGAHIWKGAR